MKLIACFLASLVLVLFMTIRAEHKISVAQVQEKGRSIISLLIQVPKSSGSLENLFSYYQQTAPALENDADFAYLVLRSDDGHFERELPLAGSRPVSFPSVLPAAAGVQKRRVRTTEGHLVIEFRAPLTGMDAPAGQLVLAFHEPLFSFSAARWGMFSPILLAYFFIAAGCVFYYRWSVRPMKNLRHQLDAYMASGELDAAWSRVVPEDSLGLVACLNRCMEMCQCSLGSSQDEQNRLLIANKVMNYQKGRLEDILDELPFGILVIDESTAAISINRHMETLLGVHREDMLSRELLEWCKEESLSSFLLQYRGHGIRLHRADAIELAPYHLAGHTVCMTAIPMENMTEGGGAEGTLVVGRDVTSEKLSSKVQGEFIAHVGHELKSPLNILKMYSEVLLDDKGRDPQMRIEAVNTIYDNVERLSGMINNLLSLSRLEMGETIPCKQRVKLSELLSDCVAVQAKGERAANLELQFDVPKEISPVWVDKELLRIAINNLLTNAIKYNRPHGSVMVQAEESKDHIIIRVRDSGIGIHERDLSMIFDKFYRSGAEEIRSLAGHGLGLSLAKSIIELHHGRLVVESSHGEGSTFTISLDKKGVVREGI